MATHFSVLAWRIPGTWWLAICGVAQSQTRLMQLSSSSSMVFGCEFICCSVPQSCLILCDPMDGGAWWAAVYGVAHGRTRLKQQHVDYKVEEVYGSKNRKAGQLRELFIKNRNWS